MRRMHNTGIGRYARNIFRATLAEAPGNEYVAVVQSEEDAAIVAGWGAASAARVACVVAPARQFSPREMIAPPRVTPAVDLWHSPHPFQMGFRASEPMVLMLHDVIPITHPFGALNVLAREPIRAIWRRACRRADAFVANSEVTRDAFHEHFGVPRERVLVTHLGPDPVFATAPDARTVAAARARWGLRDRTVLYVGMSQPHKNLDRLLQAFALLLREAGRGGYAAPPTLAVIGPNVPSERRTLLRRIGELGLGRHVHFLGTLPDEELRLAYHAADLVVQPSLVEGFGLTALEAMHCGTPVVASNIPAFREITGGAAVLVDPLDPAAIARGIATVLTDKRLASDLRARGRANAARYTWRAAARGTLAAYELALSAAHRRGHAVTRPARAAITAPVAAPARVGGLGRLRTPPAGAGAVGGGSAGA